MMRLRSLGLVLARWGLVTMGVGVCGWVWFKNQSAGCACGGIAEGRNVVGAMARAQQAYYMEEGKFSDSIAALGIGIQEETPDNHYRIELSDRSVFAYAIPQRDRFFASASGVFLTEEKGVFQRVVCVADRPDFLQLPTPSLVDGKPVCGEGSSPQ